jgi:hypothetical protein
MATTIVTKNGTGAPTDSDLVAGELAVDLTNGRLYTTDLDSGGTVIEIGLNPSGNVDVTGTVTADGITNNGDVVFSKSTTGVPIIKMSGFANANNPYGIINFYNEDGSQQGPNNAVQIKALAKNVDGSGGELAFHTSTGTSSEGADAVERMRIDANGNVGIGTSSVSAPLHLKSSTANAISIQENGSATTGTGQSSRFISTTSDVTDVIDSNGYYRIGSSTNPVTGAGFAERMRIDASGNVGINATTIAANGLQIGDTSSTDTEQLFLYSNKAIFSISTDGATNAAGTTIAYSWANGGQGPLKFDNATSTVMTLDASGNLLVGTTSSSNTPSQGIALMQNTSVGSIGIGHANGTSSGNGYMNFAYNGGAIGSVTQSGTTAVLYNTSSDQRLKENIADADDAGSKVDAIQVRKFDWKSDGSHQDYGMVAQELLDVAPEAVSAPEDPEEMMGVDYSKLVPMLVKEIQSLRARVAALES